MKVPMPEDLRMVPKMRLMSAHDGRRMTSARMRSTARWTVADLVEQLGDGEKPDKHGDETDPLAEFGMPKVKRSMPVVRWTPTVASSTPTAPAISCATTSVPRSTQHGECEDRQREVFGGREAQRNVCEQRGREQEDDQAYDAADDAGERGEAEGTARLPALGHGIAVERGCRRRRRAWRVDENGRNRAAERAGTVECGHH